MVKGRINNVIRIPTSLKGEFFRYWLEFLLPFHHLTAREIDVVTAFLKLRFELSKSITDPKLLDEVTMSDKAKHRIKEECNMSPAHFQVIMSKLKKCGIIKDNRINPKFIPKHVSDKDDAFQLLLYFDLNKDDSKDEPENRGNNS